MKMMAYIKFNHIMGKKGSRWTKFLRKTGTENLMIVAIDAAKYTHKALISTFYGDILVKPFEFDASLPGYKRLKDTIESQKVKHNLKEIVVGIETTGHYYEDLVRKCQADGYHVRIINSATTAQERKTLMNDSKTDNLDLMTIVQSLIHGRGTSSELPSGDILTLQKLTRARRELVNERTEIQNMIRMHMDHIFREFQGKLKRQKNGELKKVQPFSDLFGKASLYIMRHYPHPSDIIALGEKGLREISRRENLKIRDRSIQILMDFAKNSISQPKEMVEVDIFLLSQKLDRLDLLTKQIKILERKIEDLFVGMKESIILSVPGIGIVTGAELCAEMGDISEFEHAGQLIKLAGTNPIVIQSGGRTPSYHRISKQGRKTFRNIIYQVGRSLAFNNPEMNQKYVDLRQRGKLAGQAYIALGNRMVRLAFSMIRNQTLYRTNDENYVLKKVIETKLCAKNVNRFFEVHVLSKSQLSA